MGLILSDVFQPVPLRGLPKTLQSACQNYQVSEKMELIVLRAHHLQKAYGAYCQTLGKNPISWYKGRQREGRSGT
jgi:hypothetical protein